MTITLIVLAVFILANVGLIALQNQRVPALGVENGQLKPLSKKPNCVSTQAEDAEKRVPTLPFKGDAAATMTAIKAAIASYGGATIKEESATYLYAVFTTAKMKYNDDVEFWLDTDANEVHFRSASRAGYSDMGLNRQRFEKLAELYRQQ